MTEPTELPGDDFRAGDQVAHRESGKLGVILAVLDAGVYWMANLETAARSTAWVVVQWQGEQRPAVESVTDLIKRTQE